MKERARRAIFLSDHTDLSVYSGCYYLDLGARTYSSSALWFKNHYPKFIEASFKTIAFEADAKYSGEYSQHPEVIFHNLAVWTKNETLSFRGEMGFVDVQGNNSGASKKVRVIKDTKPIQTQAFDFAEYLLNNFKETDFLVVKMDIEGAEYVVVPKLIETGAIRLIDEIFLEGHTAQFNKIGGLARGRTYAEVIVLLQSMRALGVHAHEWF